MAKKDTARAPRLLEGKKTLGQWGITLPRLQDHSLTLAEIEARIGQDPAADVALAALLGEDYHAAVPKSGAPIQDLLPASTTK